MNEFKQQLALTVDKIKGINSREKCLLVAFFQDEKQLLTSRLSDVEIHLHKNLKGEWDIEECYKKSAQELVLCAQHNVEVVPMTARVYPTTLKEIHKPPFILYVKGKGFYDPWQSLAIVGTRKPSHKGGQTSFQFALEASLSGCHIVSGGARGIDSFAHAGALKVFKATTAVMGCGFQHLFPKEQIQQMYQILDYGGTWVSEYAPWVRARNYYFPLRNRIIVGLTRGVLVSEAPLKSGAMITAYNAVDEGRDIYIHSNLLTSKENEGCRKLHENGAKALDSFDDLAEEWNKYSHPLQQGRLDFSGWKDSTPLVESLKKELDHEVIRHRDSIYASGLQKDESD